MERRTVRETRSYSPGEETANWITHGIGALLSVAALALLVVAASLRGDAWHVTSFAVFGATLVLLYTGSTLYHALRAERAKAWWLKFDHAAIFLLIAGTYTPFLLTSLRGPWGWSLLGVIWTLCGVGAVLQFARGVGRTGWSTLAYVLAGWLVVVAIHPMLAKVPHGGLWLLLAGGLSYTFGVLFYRWHRLRYHHAVWHVFVLGGSVCHFLAVLLYLLPQTP
ncbi:MAG: hemolysin III family protein [Opitutaceae bacterium]|nr:hemolysin III family protein [Opitutaceae bacterium]